MADVQTPTEASLLSTSNPAIESTESESQSQSREAGTKVSSTAPSTATTTEPTPAPRTAVNGDKGSEPATLTNGTHAYAPAPDASIATAIPTTKATTTSTSTSAAPLLADEPKQNGKPAFNDENDPPLFSPSLISEEVAARLPEGYTIRPLRRSDYYGGFLPTLRVLTTVGEPTLAEFNARYDFISSRNDTYYILVICDETATVVGTGAVIVERKFIHNMGLVGHIEDIAVAKNQQGKKLGLRIIQSLDAVAEKVGCYKSILDCSEANEGFYVKCGFKRAGLEMAHYYEPGPKSSYERS
ncbi:glucosamine-phosphate N-acetyltransferase [Cladophialophora yegresii CBS 114405]|uniref:Glucosamine 6-phosphate N-acetyltransferase n=1 Tax=Cladophialophora yegresii CBS 114405 TaxID=1182544 RepID=W9WE84_9EURO|nr:glucosamine-phosphate N-acetyltransferase [Cladophialophora yegresii CBS 114405]EXJ62856.1 glucosamine-phosphate N-acetyltransferase [Cladophialophora yegresii CBS 114405]